MTQSGLSFEDLPSGQNERTGAAGDPATGIALIARCRNGSHAFIIFKFGCPPCPKQKLHVTTLMPEVMMALYVTVNITSNTLRHLAGTYNFVVGYYPLGHPTEHPYLLYPIHSQSLPMYTSQATNATRSRWSDKIRSTILHLLGT